MSTPAQQQTLIGIIHGSAWFMRALQGVAQLDLQHWCIGAGAVRNMVWDYLHGYETPSALSDIDVAYFDATVPQNYDELLQEKLIRNCPEFPWEVTNQAHVHQWYAAYYGYTVEPLRTLEDAVASWPEYCVSVGITFNSAHEIGVIAPHGLDDLFSMTVRRNPTRVSIESYQQRVLQKQYTLRWPRAQILPAE